MRVELLYADGDPAAMPARQNLVEVLTEDAALLEMHGSPTIRLDGVDIDPDTAGPVGLQPRAYGDDGPIPSKARIRRAVELARGWSHGTRE